jgi:hypothetical protein
MNPQRIHIAKTNTAPSGGSFLVVRARRGLAP